MIQANPERILWGSDWPHPNAVKPPGRLATEINPRFQIDDGLVLNQLALWAPDAKDRKRILVENPARLFGY
jgi:predicted TIM-barrel fold metal-dependent hydrolase